MKDEKNGHDSGHIRVKWMECPNKKCPSRHFSYWDVDFKGARFWCGTCEIRLRTPCFLAGKIDDD